MIAKRFCSYAIDMLILLFLVFSINILFDNSKEAAYYGEMNEIHEQMLHHQMTIQDYLEKTASVSQKIDQANIFANLLDLIFICVLFIIIPFFNHGATIGQKLCKLKTVVPDGPVTIESLLSRSILLNGLFYLGLVVLLCYLLPAPFYFYTVSIFGILQILLVIISGFMVLYRKDHSGLHDFISNTRIVSENGEVKK